MNIEEAVAHFQYVGNDAKDQLRKLVYRKFGPVKAEFIWSRAKAGLKAFTPHVVRELDERRHEKKRVTRRGKLNEGAVERPEMTIKKNLN